MPTDETVDCKQDRIRVLVADDSPAVLKSLCAWLDAQPRLQVVAVAGDGQSAVQSAGVSQPDLALLDLEMPVMSGLHATQTLKRHYPDIKVVVISTHASDMWNETSLNCGAEGFVSKQRIVHELPPLVERLFPATWHRPGSVPLTRPAGSSNAVGNSLDQVASEGVL